MIKTKSKKSDVIQEPMSFVGQPQDHILKIMFDGLDEKIPEIKSIGYTSLPGTNRFFSYIITSKGREILKIEVLEPDFKAIAMDQTKVNFEIFESRDLS